MPATSRNFLLLPAASFVLALGLSSTARAEMDPTAYPLCGREPTESDTQAAKGAFSAGEVSFQEADYARAILYWEDAFRRDCTAEKLLLNLARAYELSAKRKRAVLALETYLERRPDAADRDAIEKRIANLRRQIEEEEAAATSVAKPETEPAPVAATEPEPEPAAEPSSGGGKPIWPIVLTGAGVVMAGIGVPLWVSGQSAYDDKLAEYAALGCVPENCPNNLVELANEEVSGPRAQRNLGIGLTIAGGVTAIAGGVLWGVLWSQSSSSATLTPLLGPGLAGFSYQGTF